MKLHQTRRGAVATSAQLLLAVLSVALISGCDTVNEVMQPDKIDYKSQAKKGPTLEVPPDLTGVQADRRYAAPDSGTTTLSAYTSTAPKVTTPGSGTDTVLPNVSDMRIERDGNQRWLVVKTTPDAVWPQLRTFWQELARTARSRSTSRIAARRSNWSARPRTRPCGRRARPIRSWKPNSSRA
jgi:outer membrane protein assembly factor BamC